MAIFEKFESGKGYTIKENPGNRERSIIR